MKKIISTIVIIALIATTFYLVNPTETRAAISVVQAASDFESGTPAASVTITLTSGNLLYVVAGFNGNGSGCGTITVSDTASNTYTPISAYVNQSYNCSRDYYANNITGGSVTISVQSTPNAAKSFTVYEISGLDTSSPLDANNSKTCSASPCTSASFSTAQADEIIFVGATDYYTGTWSAGSIGGTTATIASGGSQNGGDGVLNSAIEYRIVSSTQSSITGSISKTGSIYMALFVASFKQASGGGGGGAVDDDDSAWFLVALDNRKKLLIS